MPRLTRIADQVAQLPSDEQLWLMERIVRHLRESSVSPSEADSQLAAMAADPEIARELDTIDKEFRVTEMDGLGKS